MVSAGCTFHAHGVAVLMIFDPFILLALPGILDWPFPSAHPVLTHSFRHSSIGPSPGSNFSPGFRIFKFSSCFVAATSVWRECVPSFWLPLPYIYALCICM